MLTIYKASAGSGKTFSLARKYLTLLLGVPTGKEDANGFQILRLNHVRYSGTSRACGRGGVEPNRHRGILAITFTNKATDEMKLRIIKELNLLAHPELPEDKKSGHLAFLCQTFQCTEQDLAETAAMAMRQLLNDFGHFNVSTIDSFFQSLMRSLAYELDCPGDYEVTLDAKAIVSEGVNLLLDDFNYSSDPSTMHGTVAGMLRGYMKQMRSSDGSFNIFNRNNSLHRNLVNEALLLFDEKYRGVAPEFEKWLDSPDALAQMETALDSLDTTLDTAYTNRIKRVTALFTSMKASNIKVSASLTKLINKLENGELKSADLDSVTNGRIIGGTLAENAKSLLNSPHSTNPPAVFPEMVQLLRKCFAVIVRKTDVEAVRREMPTFRLLRRIKANIDRYRQNNNLVVLADTAETLQKVMGGEQEIPFIYEKVGTRLRHFLIDEFQDTSRMQWASLEPLVTNGLSEGNESLIIGDVKQAIYRFRNSDSALLDHEVQTTYRGRSQVVGNSAELNTNRRSAPEIVRFNNTLFRRLAALLNIPGYGAVVQDVDPRLKDVSGYVQFFNFKKQSAKKEDKRGIEAENTVATEKTGKNRVELMLEAMLAEIRRQLAAGYRYSDILVLTDTNTQGVKVANCLIDNGIPVATEEALLLKNNISVKLIISALEMFVRRRGDKARKSADTATPQPNPYRRVRNVQCADLVALFNTRHNELVLRGTDVVDAANLALEQSIDILVDRSTEVNVTEDITSQNPSTLTSLIEVIAATRITPSQRAVDAPFIAAFHDLALSFSGIQGNNPVEFLRWWNKIKKKQSIVSPAELNAVSVMTIHKSKGLERDCVHIPFATWKLEGKDKFVDKVWLTVPERLTNLGLPPSALIALNSLTSNPLSVFCEDYRKNRTGRRIDGFNKTYVAFTRACRELSVYYSDDEGIGKDLAEVFAQVLDAEEVALQAATTIPRLIDISGGYDPDSGNVTLGMPGSPLIKKEEDTVDPRYVLDSYDIALEGDGERITRMKSVFSASSQDDLEFADAELEDEELSPTPHLPERVVEAAERGDRIHGAMQMIHSIGGLELALGNARTKYQLREDEEQVVRDFLDSPELAPWINEWFVDFDHARNEVSVFNPQAADKEERMKRIDRLVFTRSGEIHILDYKSTTQSRSDHKSQMHGYYELLREMYPAATVRMFLLYLDRKEVVEL